jgi:peptide/nickel transport system ATP-binding protein
MTEELLGIKDLHVFYKTDESNVYAVNGLELNVRRGQTLGLVGETGAGKTTTALSILKLLPERVGRITRGEIVLDGVDIIKATDADMQMLRGNTASMIFQDPMSSLNPVIPVGEQVAEVLMLHRRELSLEQISEQVDAIFGMVGLPASRKNEYPHQFSGGMKQRIIIAIALSCQPKLLLADEPTTALDVTIQAQVLDMMRELKERLGTSMILITHDLGVVAELCDHVAIMYAGEVIEIGALEDIFGKGDHHPYTVGLFGSIPSMTGDKRRLHPIDGLMPDPTNLPDGCKFHERCPRCMDRCRTDAPRMGVSGPHSIRCHLFE